MNSGGLPGFSPAVRSLIERRLSRRRADSRLQRRQPAAYRNLKTADWNHAPG
ncbi:MAG: hypothetical protein WKG07_14885 [Hymenobacter sp.]